MLVRYWLTALLAALASLTGNFVWAQESWPQGGFSTGYAPPAICIQGKCCADKDCCAAGACCKDGKCCKGGDCCCKSKKCDANCTCCKDNQCKCGKSGDCCCAPSGKCCCKDKASVKKADRGCCPFLSKLAKGTAIIVVMPSSLPIFGGCPLETMGMLPHPPLPLRRHVWLPTPLPPPIQTPPMPSEDSSPYSSPSLISGIVPAAPPVPVVTCAAAKPETATKVRIIATPFGDQLEMKGDDTCIRCKEMTVQIGDEEITLSRFDDRVRVRGEGLKATADSVRSDRKDHVILEGDVVLRYKKYGHSANVTSDCIELNLSSGAVTIKPVIKSLGIRPVLHIERIDANGP